MNSFDIIGPVMVGPSSSHTAGAAKIGNIARKLLGTPVQDADIYFHGSFLATGKGHGTDKALVAGLLGFPVDDPRIADSFRYAEEAEMQYRISGIDLGDVHPNSVKMFLTGTGGQKMEIVAASVGGGAVRVTELNGLPTSFSGDYPTLVVSNLDQPGHVTEITSMLSHKSINIATMQVYRSSKGGHAVIVLECDQEIPESSLHWLAHLEGILNVTYLGMHNEKQNG